MRENRKFPRTLVLKTGVLTFGDAGNRVECAVLNISAGGACILVPKAREIPASFRLTIDHNGARYDCEVAWTAGNRMGVRFQGTGISAATESN